MMVSQFQPLAKTSGVPGLVADRSAVTEVLEADEISRSMLSPTKRTDWTSL